MLFPRLIEINSPLYFLSLHATHSKQYTNVCLFQQIFINMNKFMIHFLFLCCFIGIAIFEYESTLDYVFIYLYNKQKIANAGDEEKTQKFWRKSKKIRLNLFIRMLCEFRKVNLFCNSIHSSLIYTLSVTWTWSE